STEAEAAAETNGGNGAPAEAASEASSSASAEAPAPPTAGDGGKPTDAGKAPAAGGGAAAAAGTVRTPQLGEHLSINALARLGIADLGHIAKDLKIQGATALRKQDLIFEILKAQ